MERFSSFKEKMVLRESKESTLRKCVNLTQEQKDEALAFFNGRGQSFWSSVDWNRPKEVTWEDIQTLMQKAENTASAQKKKIKNNQTLGLDTIELGKDYEVKSQGDGWVLYHPLTHRGICVIASNEVEPKTRNHVPGWAQNKDNEWFNSNFYDEDSEEADGAHWCIAMFKTSRYWDDYTGNGMDFYVLCNFNEREEDLKKVCYQVGDKKITCWTGGDYSFNPLTKPYDEGIIGQMVDILDPPPSEEQVKWIEEQLRKFVGDAKGAHIYFNPRVYDLNETIIQKEDSVEGFPFISRITICAEGMHEGSTFEGCAKVCAKRGSRISFKLEYDRGGDTDDRFRTVVKRMGIFEDELDENLFNLHKYGVTIKPNYGMIYTPIDHWSELPVLLDIYEESKKQLGDVLTRELESIKDRTLKLLSDVFPNIEPTYSREDGFQAVLEDGEVSDTFTYDDGYAEIVMKTLSLEGEDELKDITLYSRISPSTEAVKYLTPYVLESIFFNSNPEYEENVTYYVGKSNGGIPFVSYSVTFDQKDMNKLIKHTLAVLNGLKDTLKKKTEEQKEYESSGQLDALDAELRELGGWLNDR